MHIIDSTEVHDILVRKFMVCFSIHSYGKTNHTFPGTVTKFEQKGSPLW